MTMRSLSIAGLRATEALRQLNNYGNGNAKEKITYGGPTEKGLNVCMIVALSHSNHLSGQYSSTGHHLLTLHRHCVQLGTLTNVRLGKYIPKIVIPPSSTIRGSPKADVE